MRTLDEIDQVLQLAKLNKDDLIPTTQIIYFNEQNINENNYRFLQLDQNILEDFEKDQVLFIKGDDDENMVICSNSRTYNVTETETSNSLLLMNNLKVFNDCKENSTERCCNISKIHGIFYTYLEVSVGKPCLKKLWDILEKSVYKGPEYEYEINQDDLYSFDDLNNKIQASKNELEQILNNANIVTVNGKIRLLELQYHFRVLSYMLKLIDENSWELDQICLEITIESLQDIVPEEILMNLFEKYTKKTKIIDNTQLYQYKEDEICRFFAKILLYGSGKFNLDDFLEAWQESVPDGMVTNEELLHGIAIIDRKSLPNIISYFPEDQLSEDIEERFNQLFHVKEKWTVTEIAPYIQRLATEKQDINALLAKHARASTVQGIKYYCAKHSK